MFELIPIPPAVKITFNITLQFASCSGWFAPDNNGSWDGEECVCAGGGAGYLK